MAYLLLPSILADKLAQINILSLGESTVHNLV